MTSTHTLNEVLNGDYVHLTQLLEEGYPVDVLGVRGDGPLHIAVYRHDARMLQLLLDHIPRADINFQNVQGNTALHIAALMGLPDVLELLYSYSTEQERFELLLEIKNKQGQTALDIANTPVVDTELDLTRLYAGVLEDKVASLDAVREPMILGRTKCADFLRWHMQQGRENKIKNSVGVLVDCNIARRKTNAILRGGGIIGTDQERVYTSALDYPRALDPPRPWRKEDIQIFLNYEAGVREVVLGTHAQDLAQRVEKSAFSHVALEEQIVNASSIGKDYEEERWAAPYESIGVAWRV